jgi:hypothetical protein
MVCLNALSSAASDLLNMRDGIRATQDLDMRETKRLSSARLLQLPLGSWRRKVPGFSGDDALFIGRIKVRAGHFSIQLPLSGLVDNASSSASLSISSMQDDDPPTYDH